jgi:RNA polymerase-binding protein DksA
MRQKRGLGRYEMLKSLLDNRGRELRQRLRSLLESPAEILDVKDPEEQSVSKSDQELDFLLLEMKTETWRRIDEALQRLEDGTYGVCIECEAEISAARLEALPFAELCRDCQEAAERPEAEQAPAVSSAGVGRALRSAFSTSARADRWPRSGREGERPTGDIVRVGRTRRPALAVGSSIG